MGSECQIHSTSILRLPVPFAFRSSFAKMRSRITNFGKRVPAACPAAQLALSERNRPGRRWSTPPPAPSVRWSRDGSSPFHPAADAPRLASPAQARAGNRRCGGGARLSHPACRAGAVVSLWDGGLFRNDRLRHLGLLLTSNREFHDG